MHPRRAAKHWPSRGGSSRSYGPLLYLGAAASGPVLLRGVPHPIGCRVPLGRRRACTAIVQPAVSPAGVLADHGDSPPESPSNPAITPPRGHPVGSRKPV